MPARCALRWFAISGLALSVVTSGAMAQSAVQNRFGGRLNPGSDVWFAALFKLRNPVEEGRLRFLNNHLGFPLGAVSFRIPIPQAVITFTTTDSTQSNALGGGQWISHLPFSFNDQLFFSGMSWDAAANLPGAINQTRSGNLLVMVGAVSHRKPRRSR